MKGRERRIDAIIPLVCQPKPPRKKEKGKKEKGKRFPLMSQKCANVNPLGQKKEERKMFRAFAKPPGVYSSLFLFREGEREGEKEREKGMPC